MGPEQLRGTASGVTVCAVTGLVWAASTLGGLDAFVAVPVLIAGAGIASMLLLGARRLRQSASALAGSAPAGVDLGSVRRRFNLVVVGEFIAIGVALNVLIRFDRPLWIPAAICAIVGLHFLPLARLFRVPVYNATAGALCVAAATTIVVGALGGPEAAWQLLPGFGAAFALWATGARLLTSTT